MKIQNVNIFTISQNFIEWLSNRSDKKDILNILQLEGNEISTNVYDFYGDKISGVKIEIEDLEGFGTQCGSKGNICFDKNIIDYLKECGVDHIISTIFLNEPEMLGHCLIPFNNSKNGKKFSKMIEKNEGSLTFGESYDDEYFFFECE
jgi:hypothetical protein